MPFTLDDIKIDLDIAKMLIYNKTNTFVENPNTLNMAAYHAGQCIEKSLKFVVKRDCEKDVWERVHDTHDIKSLLCAASRGNPDFIARHQDIAKYAYPLSRLNGLRYATMRIDKKNSKMIINMASKLYAEIEREFLKENPDKDANKQQNKEIFEKKKELFEDCEANEAKLRQATEESSKKMKPRPPIQSKKSPVGQPYKPARETKYSSKQKPRFKASSGQPKSNRPPVKEQQKQDPGKE